MGAPAVIGEGPYGSLGSPDANGLRLPAGFSSRVIARSGEDIGPRPYEFHILPDGMGAFRTKDGGFILTSNSEAPYLPGLAEIGAGAIRFDKNFNVVDAYPILKNTWVNCAGGVTPWHTWLSCEEIDTGKVFECDPWGRKPWNGSNWIERPALGVFKHEACCVDPKGKRLYLTEDLGDGCLYRFTPDKYPDLSSGRLEVAIVQESGKVKWAEVPDPQFTGGTPTRKQVDGATTFRRGEGMWFDGGTVYFATTQDDRVYAYHPESTYLEVLYDGVALGDAAPLHDTDNVTASPISGDLYVCEDPGGNALDGLQVCIISTEGEVAAFCEATPEAHKDSELTGPVFDPTGSRLYFSSQRAKFPGESASAGIIYEISGPFRKTRTEPRDSKKPAVKVRTLGKPTLRRLIRQGQPFMVEVADESLPVEVEMELVAPLRRARGRGSRQATIGRKRVRFGKSGRKQVQVKANPNYRKRLREGRFGRRGRLIVVAKDAAGNRTRVVKPVSFR
ncbi:MAG: DUF839 domain-containing protein [Solirubrobacterales bacterium]|nr:DUF839 domain-containing protein [Solirubrobacterales bacterium]MCB0859600.1 DUF839 domain-containing protein [Solirubrobacterales bacterium]